MYSGANSTMNIAESSEITVAKRTERPVIKAVA